MPASPTSPDKVLDQLQRFCAYQERSLYEVEQKLRQSGLTHEEQSQIITLLLEDNFLHEDRFAKAFVRGKFSIKRWGRKKIIGELYKHKVSRTTIQQALDSEISHADYQKSIRLLLTKKMKELTGDLDAFTRRNKLLAYLIQKGYEADIVGEMIDDLERETDSLL
jgi:regulatory protein